MRRRIRPSSAAASIAPDRASARGLTRPRVVYESRTTFEREEHKPCESAASSVGQRSETVRRANLSAIVRELHERGPQSRSELVARTGLTRSAIRGLIGELAAAGLVTEERAAPSRHAGPPVPARPARTRTAPSSWPSRSLVDSLAAALVGLGGETSRARPGRPAARCTLSVDEIVDRPGGARGVVRARRPTIGPIVGIGVAVAGVVRRVRRHGLDGPQPRLERRPARRAPRSRPSAVAVADHRRQRRRPRRPRRASGGAPRSGVDNVLFISGEVGVGGGLIVDGQPMTGVAGYGGEVGHIPVNPDGAPCRCGSIGCWETEVGERRAPRAGPATPPTAAGTGSTRCCARPRPAIRGRPGGARRCRPLARHRARRARQRPQPAARRPRRPARAHPSVRRRTARRASSTGSRCRAPRAARPGRPGVARRRRPAARRRRAGVRAVPRRSGGLASAAAAGSLHLASA